MQEELKIHLSPETTLILQRLADESGLTLEEWIRRELSLSIRRRLGTRVRELTEAVA